MYPFSVGVMISNYNLPFKEAVEKASRLKLDGIQLAGTREGHEFYPGVMTKDKIAELKQYLKDKNLILSAVCGEQMLGFFNRETNPQLIENSKRILDMAKELDCNIVTTHIGVIPEDTELFDIILGKMSGCIGEIASLLLILGGLYLICRRVITWHIPVCFVATVALLTFIFAPDGVNSATFMLYELFSGGLLLGAFFMATDYVTSPATRGGRIIFGIGCGALTVFIRFFGGYPEGVSFAILIMNLFVWYLDRAFKPTKFGGGKPSAKA